MEADGEEGGSLTWALPEEVQLTVMGMLTWQDLVTVGLVCRRWRCIGTPHKN